MNRNGIPTMYRRTRFRSRLEARWAFLFDSLDWRWEYEPFDLDGYIPDFLICGANPVLIEVKPIVGYDEAERIAERLPRHPKYPPLVVGSTPFLHCRDSDCVIGAIGQESADVDDDLEPTGEVSTWFSPAEWSSCYECGAICVIHLYGAWINHPNPHRLGCSHDERVKPGHINTSVIDNVWASARNTTQWQGR